MKKLMPVLTILISSFALFSCQKPYTCTCTGGLTGGTYETQVKAKSEKAASDKCAENNPAIGTPDGLYCFIKP